MKRKSNYLTYTLMGVVIIAYMCALMLLTSCQLYTYGSQLEDPVNPHFSIDTWYGPECRNADYQYSLSHSEYICVWGCATYGDHYRTGLEIHIEEHYNGEWMFREYYSQHNCSYY